MRSIYRPPWRVDVTIREGVAPTIAASTVTVGSLARAMVATLVAADAPAPGSIGLILSDDRELASLNETHLGHHGPTDVLSFPLMPAAAFPRHAGEPADRRTGAASPPFPLPPGRRPHLGDVVVSVERAIEQAVEGRGGHTGDVRWSAADELRLLVIHGTLHVCGWDHAEPAEELAMRALERRLLG
ncbi:MAG TPA: rRNA maturation RNase YbeY [Candidatus Limnocylindrales bacterium]